MIKITLTNDYHNRSINLHLRGNKLTAQQVRRAKRALCGVEGCCCSGVAGTRGGQEVSIEPITDLRTGENLGAWVYI